MADIKSSPALKSQSDNSDSTTQDVTLSDESCEDKSPPKSTGPAQQPRMHPVKWVLFVACTVSSPFLFAFDLVVVGNIQPKILERLGEVDKLSWISISYALAAVSTTLLWGRLFAVVNIKWTFIAAVVIFELGSVVSGAAPNMNVLIVGRALSGLGAIGTYMGAITYLTVVTTIKQRPLYFSFITFAYGAGTMIAPFVGGAFSDSAATWRWAFYINVCVGALFTPGYLYLFPSKDFLPESVGALQRLQKLDPLGNILWAGATASLLMGISFGGALYTWSSGQVIALFVCAGVLWIAFFVQQWRAICTTEEARIFPVACLRSLEVVLLFIQTATSTAVAVVPTFLVPIYSNSCGAVLPYPPASMSSL
nr:efflux pump patc [Quercus suber]